MKRLSKTVKSIRKERILFRGKVGNFSYFDGYFKKWTLILRHAKIEIGTLIKCNGGSI